VTPALHGRRAALGILASGAVLGAMLAVRAHPPEWVAPERGRRGLLRPPGSVDEEEFLSRCIRCQRCSEVCAGDAIRLLGPGAGRLQGTPHLVPELAGCTLCLECGKACPTGAILPLADRRDARVGTAVVDEKLCVSHNGSGICGACFTICPLKGRAIRQGVHNAPTVLADVCVGCGMCEEACIVDRDKAIRVHSSRRWS